MKSTAVYKKMKSNGYGYRSLATEINRLYGSKLEKYDVFNFVHRHLGKLSRANRANIRTYFILKGWIAKPKPRKASVCRFCGKKYPIRKPSRSNLHNLNPERVSKH